MRIDVLIPTYNRAKFAENQAICVVQLRESLLATGIDLRLVVSDNHSREPVNLVRLNNEFARVVKPDRHLYTAEENLYFGLQNCDAEYVWILADDDALIFGNIIAMFKDLQKNPTDFMVGDASGFLTHKKKMVQSRTLCSDSSAIKDLPAFARRTGFWFVLAGFSCLVVRRSIVIESLDRFKVYFEVSSIYSHVFWLLDVFWDKRFRYFNQPIVVYKQNASDVGGSQHWLNVALRDGVFEGFYWTLGYVRHAKLLMSRHRIPYSYFGETLEQNFEFRFQHLADSLSGYTKLLNRQWGRQKNKCRMPTLEEKSEYLDFVAKAEPRFHEVVSRLSSSDFRPPKSEIRECQKFLKNYLGPQFYLRFFVKSLAGWRIYFFDDVYRAVPAGQEKKLKLELSDIAPVTSIWHLVSPNLEEIEKLILARPHILNDLAHPLLKVRNKIPLIKKVYSLFKKIVKKILEKVL